MWQTSSCADGSLSVRVFRERNEREVGCPLNPKDAPFVNMAFLPLNHVVNKQLRNCLFATWFSGKKAMLTIAEQKGHSPDDGRENKSALR